MGGVPADVCVGAVGEHPGLGLRLPSDGVNLAGSHPVDVVERSRLELGHEVGLAGHDSPHHVVETGSPSCPVSCVGRENDLLLRSVALEPKRTRREDVLLPVDVMPVGIRVSSPRVGRDDEAVVGVHELIGIDAVEGEANGVGVDGLDVGDRVLDEHPGPAQLGGELGLPGEDDVLGGHWSSVAPRGIGTQVEGEHVPVLGELP